MQRWCDGGRKDGCWGGAPRAAGRDILYQFGCFIVLLGFRLFMCLCKGKRSCRTFAFGRKPTNCQRRGSPGQSSNAQEQQQHTQRQHHERNTSYYLLAYCRHDLSAGEAIVHIIRKLKRIERDRDQDAIDDHSQILVVVVRRFRLNRLL